MRTRNPYIRALIRNVLLGTILVQAGCLMPEWAMIGLAVANAITTGFSLRGLYWS